MLLLNNLNESGYNQLKKDRDILIKEIEHLNSILSQFDLAYPFYFHPPSPESAKFFPANRPRIGRPYLAVKRPELRKITGFAKKYGFRS